MLRTTMLVLLLLGPGVTAALSCGTSSGTGECACAAPGVVTVKPAAPASVVVTDGSCTIDVCRNADSAGGMCSEYLVHSNMPGTCQLRATFGDGSSTVTTVTFAFVDCCSALYADHPNWAPHE
jgi:hypothetical protein